MPIIIIIIMTNTNSGLNSVDLVYYINLDKRPDRNEQIKGELAKTNIDPAKIMRISGYDVPECGSYGCSLSHISAITQFLQHPEAQTCLILEDDFTFIQDQHRVTETVDRFFADFKDNWDVLFLSLNLITCENTKFTYAVRVLRSFCLSGYIVSKQFAPMLLANFKESAALLKQAGKYTPTLCVDNYMGALQATTRWFSITPRIGLQRASFSDIEKRYVNYGC